MYFIIGDVQLTSVNQTHYTKLDWYYWKVQTFMNEHSCSIHLFHLVSH